MKNHGAYTFIKFARKITALLSATLILLCVSSCSYAVTRGELLADIFAKLGYAPSQNLTLPPDVYGTHTYAREIGSSLNYRLIPHEDFRPDNSVNRHEAVLLALQMMGWGFEASLYQSLTQLPDMGGSGDPVFFLAAEMRPPAPSALLTDGDTPLSDSAKAALLSWVRQCRSFVQWNVVFSYGGTDLVIYRQGVARPDEPEPANITGNPVGSGRCEPLYVAALAVRPGATDQHIAFAEPLGRGRVTPSEFALSYGAIGVVNGGFFSNNRPMGTMLLDGTHVGKPLPGRSAVGWNNGSTPVFGTGTARIGVKTPGAFVDFTRFNAPPDPNGAALYSSHVTGAAEGIASDALELVVRKGVVSERRESYASNHRTPDDGVLVTARGNSRRLLEGLRAGDAVDIQTGWLTQSFSQCENLIQAGPMLLLNGQFKTDTESFKANILDKRHPRTIMGTDGTRSFWAVIDGRNARHSRGATIEETRWVAKSLGLVSAINMDGGGSSQLIWRGLPVNVPSDGKERPLPYAILVTPKGERLARRLTPVGAAEDSEYGGAPPSSEDDDVWMDTYIPAP